MNVFDNEVLRNEVVLRTNGNSSRVSVYFLRFDDIPFCERMIYNSCGIDDMQCFALIKLKFHNPSGLFHIERKRDISLFKGVVHFHSRTSKCYFIPPPQKAPHPMHRISALHHILLFFHRVFLQVLLQVLCFSTRRPSS